MNSPQMQSTHGAGCVRTSSTTESARTYNILAEQQLTMVSAGLREGYEILTSNKAGLIPSVDDEIADREMTFGMVPLGDNGKNES